LYDVVHEDTVDEDVEDDNDEIAEKQAE